MILLVCNILHGDTCKIEGVHDVERVVHEKSKTWDAHVKGGGAQIYKFCWCRDRSKGRSELCLFGFITGYLMALRPLFDRWSTFIIVKYPIFSHGWYFQFIFFMYCILKFVNCIAIVRNLSLSFFYVKFKISKHFVYRPSRTMLFNEIQSSNTAS